MLFKIEKKIESSARVLNGVAAAAIAGMMLLTCADVVLRLFRFPIPGTYEMVGFFGSVFVSFSLAKTSIEQGHIAVDFFVKRFPQKIRQIIFMVNSFVCAVLFGFAFWYSVMYALDLRESGEVSLTLQMPIYPFVFGTAIGCGFLCMVLMVQFLKAFRKERG